MKTKLEALAVLALAHLAAVAALASDTYEGSLKAGDEHRQYGRFELALSEYDTAIERAANATEKALALSKTAAVYAFDKKDCDAAKAAAQEALDLPDTQPIGRVTAMEALAECMKAARDYAGAAALLEDALKLDGVDWAKPSLTLSLGDCLRFSGQFDRAIGLLKDLATGSAADSGIRAVANLNIGLTYQYGLGNPALAREFYRKAGDLNPSLRPEIASHEAKLP